MDQPKITVTRATYVAPVTVLGEDDQGRALVVCSQCSGIAHVEQDGRVVCEDWAPIQQFLDGVDLGALEAAALGVPDA